MTGTRTLVAQGRMRSRGQVERVVEHMRHLGCVKELLAEHDEGMHRHNRRATTHGLQPVEGTRLFARMPGRIPVNQLRGTIHDHLGGRRHEGRRGRFKQVNACRSIRWTAVPRIELDGVAVRCRTRANTTPRDVAGGVDLAWKRIAMVETNHNTGPSRSGAPGGSVCPRGRSWNASPRSLLRRDQAPMRLRAIHEALVDRAMG